MSEAVQRSAGEILRYLVSGGMNFVISLLIFAIFLEILLLPYLLALFLTWLIGMILMYLLSTRWVFQNNGQNKHSHAAFVRLLAVGVVSITLNMIALGVVVENLGADPFWGQLALMPLVVAFNFMGTKFFALARPNQDNDTKRVGP